MKVVTNTSPLLNLAVVKEARLLPELFEQIIAPEKVREEIEILCSGDSRFQSADTSSVVDYVSVSDQSHVRLLSLQLDPGESEAIALALEVKADLILLDERRATRIARQLGLRTLGLLGVLMLAKNRGLIAHVRPLIDRLTNEAGFWIAPELYRQICEAVNE